MRKKIFINNQDQQDKTQIIKSCQIAKKEEFRKLSKPKNNSISDEDTTMIQKPKHLVKKVPNNESTIANDDPWPEESPLEYPKEMRYSINDIKKILIKYNDILLAQEKLPNLLMNSNIIENLLSNNKRVFDNFVNRAQKPEKEEKNGIKFYVIPSIRRSQHCVSKESVLFYLKVLIEELNLTSLYWMPLLRFESIDDSTKHKIFFSLKRLNISAIERLVRFCTLRMNEAYKYGIDVKVQVLGRPRFMGIALNNMGCNPKPL